MNCSTRHLKKLENERIDELIENYCSYHIDMPVNFRAIRIVLNLFSLRKFIDFEIFEIRAFQ